MNDEQINVTLSFSRYGGERDEQVSFNFNLKPDETYYPLLEKVEQLIVALGYVPNGHLDFVSSETQDTKVSFLQETPSNVTTMFTINP
jgi:hypothetical protein